MKFVMICDNSARKKAILVIKQLFLERYKILICTSSGTANISPFEIPKMFIA